MAGTPPSPEISTQPKADLALEGGGVKGIGLVGAITTLASHGYTFPRVAGTSAGAIVGALVAACVASEKNVTLVEEIMNDVHYPRFRDESVLDHLGPPGEIAELLLSRGIYKGDYFHGWIESQLKTIGVEKFGQLRISDKDDPGSVLPEERRYRLVVLTSDVTRGQLVYLPWDCKDYDLDPDELRIADAVRSSMSIPFFFRPYDLPGTKSTFVDGGMLENFPIDAFDRPDGNPRWPTFGVKLSVKPDPAATVQKTTTTLDLAVSCLRTLIDEHDAYHLEDTKTTQRTIFVDTTGISATDFDITKETQQTLFANGQRAATKFIGSWPEAHFDDKGKWLG
jgi:NTE family protein